MAFMAGRARTSTAVASALSAWQQSSVSPKPLPPRQGFIDSWVALFTWLIRQQDVTVQLGVAWQCRSPRCRAARCE